MLLQDIVPEWPQTAALHNLKESSDFKPWLRNLTKKVRICADQRSLPLPSNHLFIQKIRVAEPQVFQQIPISLSIKDTYHQSISLAVPQLDELPLLRVQS